MSRLILVPLPTIAILLAFSISFSVALDNLLLACLLILGVLGAFGSAFNKVLENPVARAAWILFAMLLIATFYGDAPWKDAFGTLAKYDDLAFVPLFMVAFSQRKHVRSAIFLFVLAMGTTMLLSYALGLGLIGHQRWMWPVAESSNPAIFHGSITQNILMAYMVFLTLLYARDNKVMWQRALILLFALAGAANVLFMVIGRTGYLVLFALLFYFAWQMFKKKTQAAGRRIGYREIGLLLLVGLLVGWGGYHASARMHQRIDQVLADSKAWQPGVANKVSDGTSTGERLTFYYNTLQIIRAHPLFGVGTGGFPQAYAKQVAGTGVEESVNPHEEYLMLTVQAGIMGLVLMLYWLYVQWRESLKLETDFYRDAARGLVLTIAISCLVNSSLLDHVEGLFYSYMGGALFAGLRKA